MFATESNDQDVVEDEEEDEVDVADGVGQQNDKKKKKFDLEDLIQSISDTTGLEPVNLKKLRNGYSMFYFLQFEFELINNFLIFFFPVDLGTFRCGNCVTVKQVR